MHHSFRSNNSSYRSSLSQAKEISRERISPHVHWQFFPQNQDVLKPGGPRGHAWPRESDQNVCYIILLPAHPHSHQEYHY